MLEIEIPRTEIWDNENEMFSYVDSCKLVLEHSLISISKWESKWNKPFLTRDEKTPEEMIDYVKCMIVNHADPVVCNCLTTDNYKQINDYKLFVFEGKVKCIQVDYDRFANHRRNFYDPKWNYMPFTTLYKTDPTHYIEKPECLE